MSLVLSDLLALFADVVVDLEGSDVLFDLSCCPLVTMMSCSLVMVISRLFGKDVMLAVL